MIPDVSPRGSFKGWVFGTWLTKNKGFVKTILSLYLAFVTTIGLGEATAALVQVGAATLVTVLVLGAKLALDAVDFFASDVDLP